MSITGTQFRDSAKCRKRFFRVTGSVRIDPVRVGLQGGNSSVDTVPVVDPCPILGRVGVRIPHVSSMWSLVQSLGGVLRGTWGHFMFPKF